LDTNSSSKRVKTAEKKYQIAKNYIKKYKIVNSRLKDQIKYLLQKQKSSKNRTESKQHFMKVHELEDENLLLRKNLNDFKMENKRLLRQISQLKQHRNDNPTRRQSDYQENRYKVIMKENSYLRKQIYEMNSKYNRIQSEFHLLKVNQES
jgi:hypothetical protein